MIESRRDSSRVTRELTIEISLNVSQLLLRGLPTRLYTHTHIFFMHNFDGTYVTSLCSLESVTGSNGLGKQTFVTYA